MALKPDQERIKSLLSETITLLCRNGLNFKSEFSVEALIGITLDKSDVFLVNIRETIQSAETATEPASTWEEATVDQVNTGSSGETKRLGALRKDTGTTDFRTGKQNDVLLGVSSYSRSSGGRFGSSSMGWEDDGVSKEIAGRGINKFESDDLAGDHNDSASRRKRARIDLPTSSIRQNIDNSGKVRSSNPREIGNKQKDDVVSFTTDAENSTRNDLTESLPGSETSNIKSELSLERQSRSPGSRKGPSVDCQSLVKQTVPSHDVESEELLEDTVETHNEDSDTDEVVFVKNEPSEYRVSDTNISYVEWMQRNTSEQLRENAYEKSGEWMERDNLYEEPTGTPECRPHRKRYRSKVAGQLTERAGPSNEYDVMDIKLARNLSSSVVTDLSTNYFVSHSVETAALHPTGAPDLSGEELIIARSVLSMRGSFISLGCLKANRQLIRRVSREHLMAIINKMSTPTDPAYFIGLLFDFGISRVFYKCPPASVSDAALMFYGFSGVRYADCFMRKVIVDKNIRDPETWIQKLQERSPFLRQ